MGHAALLDLGVVLSVVCGQRGRTLQLDCWYVYSVISFMKVISECACATCVMACA